MPKNICQNSFKIVAIVVALLSPNSVVLGQTGSYHDAQTSIPYPWTIGQVWGLVDAPPYGAYTTVIELGNTIASYYNPDLRFTGFPASHITRDPNNRCIAHWVGISIPTTYSGMFAVPPSGNTADAGNRLWDTVYTGGSGYTGWGYTKIDPTASIDTSMNCHGYSTGRGAWMSLSPVLEDDYSECNKFDDLVPGYFDMIFATTSTISTPVGLSVGSHSARIIDVKPDELSPSGQEFKWITVQEKNRVSALYKRDFVISKDPSKPGRVVLPVVLPWGTFSHFYVPK